MTSMPNGKKLLQMLKVKIAGNDKIVIRIIFINTICLLESLVPSSQKEVIVSKTAKIVEKEAKIIKRKKKSPTSKP